jgi:hypothetical protein
VYAAIITKILGAKSDWGTGMTIKYPCAIKIFFEAVQVPALVLHIVFQKCE